jgi:hypothetical protein
MLKLEESTEQAQVEDFTNLELGFVPSLFQLVMFGWIIWDWAELLGEMYRTIGWEGQEWC